MTRAMRGLTFAFLTLVACLVAIAGSLLLSGQAAVVITHGVSMNPVYYEKDLVVVARAPFYEAGDIVAYHLPADGTVVLHRITGGSEEKFEIKGDNNPSIDAFTPSAAQLIGRAVAHVPQGGVWLSYLTSPPMLAALAFLLLIGGGGVAAFPHTRRLRRTHVQRNRTTRPRATTPVTALALGAAATVLGLIGGALALPAWLGPLEERATHTQPAAQLRFSYGADVGHSAAYDGTTVNSPDPVFRKITDTVDVHIAYRGAPGTLTIDAQLSSESGWRSAVSLATPLLIGETHNRTVTLDLADLEERATAAAAATGIPFGPVALAITARVRSSNHTDFRAVMDMVLTPVQLSLADPQDDLMVMRTWDMAGSDDPARRVGPGPVSITAETARATSLGMLAAALLLGVLAVLAAHRTAGIDEAMKIRRRYRKLLADVEPLSLPATLVIDTADFATLARLAERYGLLVLTWTRGGISTFVVHDQACTYRYRSAPRPSQG